MQWFVLIQSFVTVATGSGDTMYLHPNEAIADPEGWLKLEQLFPPEQWQDQAFQKHVRFHAALLEDIGFLKRRDKDGVPEFRATFTAYQQFLNWPSIEPEKREPERPSEGEVE